MEDQEPATPGALTTAQKERAGPDYVAAVGSDIARAISEMEDGKGVADDEFWKEFGHPPMR